MEVCVALSECPGGATIEFPRVESYSNQMCDGATATSVVGTEYHCVQEPPLDVDVMSDVRDDAGFNCYAMYPIWLTAVLAITATFIVLGILVCLHARRRYQRRRAMQAREKLHTDSLGQKVGWLAVLCTNLQDRDRRLRWTARA